MKYFLMLYFLVPVFCEAQNVGIGTTNPNRGKLQIEGSLNGTMLTMQYKKDSNGISYFANDYANIFMHNCYLDSARENFRRLGSGKATLLYSTTSGELVAGVDNVDGLPNEIVQFNVLPFFHHQSDGKNIIRSSLSIDTTETTVGINAKLLINQASINESGAGLRIVQPTGEWPSSIELGRAGRYWILKGQHTVDTQYFAINNDGLGDAFYINRLGNVGIGYNTGDPKRTLHVSAGKVLNAPITPSATAIFEDDAGFTIQLISPNNSQSGIVSGNQATSIRAGILFAADSAISFRAGGNNTRMFLSKTGNVTIDGVLTQNSDSRLKTNIHPLENSLQKILKLNGLQYEWKDADRQPGLHTGLLAQEVELLMPELVSEDEEGTKSVNYTALIPYLVESIKTQQKEIDLLKEQLRKKNSKRK